MDTEQLIARYNAARRKLSDSANTKVGNNGVMQEAEYAQAYGALVKAGVRPKLKGKYRAST